jgi:DNA mismatch repair protein MutS
VYGVSSINIFTGETTLFEHDTPFILNPTTFDELENYISIVSPSEVIVISKLDEKTTDTILQYSGIKTSNVHKYIFSELNNERKQIFENCEKQNYNVHILSTFFGKECYYVCSEFQTYIIATQSFCYLIHYIQQHNPDLVRKIALPVFNNKSCKMILANHTLKQLNIIQDDSNDSKNAKQLSSVLSFLNKCCSSIGKRKFIYQLTNPTFDITWLNHEYKMIGQLLENNNSVPIENYRKHLSKINDLEKISRQIILKKIYPSSIYKLYKSIFEIIEINKLTSFLSSPTTAKLNNSMLYFLFFLGLY